MQILIPRDSNSNSEYNQISNCPLSNKVIHFWFPWTSKVESDKLITKESNLQKPLESKVEVLADKGIFN